MNLRTLLLLLLLGLIAAFAAINWSAFTALTPLSVVVTTIQAPLGLIMLVATAILALLLIIVAAHLKATMLVDSRRHKKDLQVLRKLADDAEASRLTTLQQYLEAELQKQSTLANAVEAALLRRLDSLENSLKESVEQGSNSLAAYLGEIDDRMERAQRLAAPGGAPQPMPDVPRRWPGSAE